MTQGPDWRDLLVIADGDHKALKVLLDTAEMPFGISCFHAQQAVEKYFKVVLRFRSIDYPYTHDLVILMEVLEKNGVILPFTCEDVDKLNPFAVQVRYDLPPEIPVSRSEVEKIVAIVANWCKEQIHD